LIPNVDTYCNDGSGNRSQGNKADLFANMSNGVPGSVEQSMSCNIPPWGNGSGPLARLTWRCDQTQTTASSTTASFALTSHTERKCGQGPMGSAAFVKPRWVMALSAPDPSKTYDVTVAVQASASFADCTISVGNSASAVPAGSTQKVFSGLPAGTYQVAIDCSGGNGFAALGCYGAPPPGQQREGVNVSPARSDASMTATVTAAAH
jgi:hypothetical protein